MKRLLFFFFALIVLSIRLLGQEKIAGRLSNDWFKPFDKNILTKEFSGRLSPFMKLTSGSGEQPVGRVGFIDHHGNIIIKPIYDNVSEFDDGYALVEIDKLCGVIDTTGKIIIPIKYRELTRCKNGWYIWWEGRSVGLMNRNGKTIVAPGKYINIAYPPPVAIEDGPMEQDHWYLLHDYRIDFIKYLGVSINKKWTVIDLKGQALFSPRFEGLEMNMFVGDYVTVSKNKKYGIADKDGNLLVIPRYDGIQLLNNNLAIATQNKKAVLINVNGKILIPEKYDYIQQIQPFSFEVQDNTDDYDKGVVSATNRVIIPVKNRLVGKFGNGYFTENPYGNTVEDQQKHDKVRALFDKNGKQISKATEGAYGSFPFWISNEGCYVYRHGHYLFYQRIIDVLNKYLLHNKLFYYKNKKWGLMDTLGRELTAPLYDSVKFLPNTPLMVKQENKWGVLNIDVISRLNKSKTPGHKH